MSTPSGDQPTRAFPATAEQPAPTTDAPPPPATFWRQRVPAHIGRARTSTVVLAVLFVVMGGLYLGFRTDYVTVTTVDGDTVRVDRSQLSNPITPTEPAESTEPTGPAAPTTGAPQDTGSVTPPRTTTPGATTAPRSPAPTPTSAEEELPESPTSSRETTPSRAPSTTEEPAPATDGEQTATPTG